MVLAMTSIHIAWNKAYQVLEVFQMYLCLDYTETVEMENRNGQIIIQPLSLVVTSQRPLLYKDRR